MKESKVREKLQLHTSEFSQNNNSISKILEYWKKEHPIYFIETVLNTESPISSKILINTGLKAHNNIYKSYIKTNTAINNYFDLLESTNINRMSFKILKNSIDIICSLIESKEITEALKQRAHRLSFLINSRIEKVKTYDLVEISIGDHEHNETKDHSFYCSAKNELKELFNIGQKKIEKCFVEFVENQSKDNQEISYFIKRLSEFEVSEVSHIDDDSNSINLAYIYLEIANLGGPVDYCYANGQETVSLWRYEY